MHSTQVLSSTSYPLDSCYKSLAKPLLLAQNISPRSSPPSGTRWIFGTVKDVIRGVQAPKSLPIGVPPVRPAPVSVDLRSAHKAADGHGGTGKVFQRSAGQPAVIIRNVQVNNAATSSSLPPPRHPPGLPIPPIVRNQATYGPIARPTPQRRVESGQRPAVMTANTVYTTPASPIPVQQPVNLSYQVVDEHAAFLRWQSMQRRLWDMKVKFSNAPKISSPLRESTDTEKCYKAAVMSVFRDENHPPARLTNFHRDQSLRVRTWCRDGRCKDAKSSKTYNPCKYCKTEISNDAKSRYRQRIAANLEKAIIDAFKDSNSLKLGTVNDYLVFNQYCRDFSLKVSYKLTTLAQRVSAPYSYDFDEWVTQFWVWAHYTYRVAGLPDDIIVIKAADN